MHYKWKQRILLILKGWVGSVLIAVLLATSIKSAIADWNVVPTGSMKPTIVEGDRIFVNKLAYDLKIPYTTWHLAQWDHPVRGDIVVFFSPMDGKRLVKRVVGVPGDTLSMKNNRLFINGEPLAYEAPEALEDGSVISEKGFPGFRILENLPGKKHAILISPQSPSPRTFRSIEVPEGAYFMMGDNRDHSADSRYFGFVDRNLILGRATAIVASLNILDHYKPRWERFFSSLD